MTNLCKKDFVALELGFTPFFHIASHTSLLQFPQKMYCSVLERKGGNCSCIY